MSGISRGVAFVIALLAGVAPGLANDARDCAGNEPNAAIRGCDALLASGGLDPARMARVRFNRGLALFRAQKYPESVDDFTIAINVSGNGGAAAGLADFHGSRGLAYRMMSRFDEAITDFTRAIAIDGTKATYYVSRAEAYHASRNLAGALSDYQTAITLNANFARAHLGLAQTYAALNRPIEASAAYGEVIRIDPRNVNALTERGFAWLSQNRVTEAISDFGVAISIDPNAARALHGRGLAQIRLRQYQPAIADFDKALALNPRFALAFIDRGNAYLETKSYAAAYSDYDRAVALLPGFAIGLHNRGYARWKLGRPEEAIIDFAQAIAANPAYAEAYVNRGEVYLQLGQHDLAERDFAEALKHNPALNTARSGQTRVATARGTGKAVAAPLKPLAQATVVPAAPPTAVAALTPQVPLSAIPPATIGQKGRRIALVIGNATYQHTSALINPTNDASDIAGSLRRIGFEVIVETNLTKRGMDDAFRRFAREITGSEIAMFFYAGHAMQYNGVNYLMPIDAQLREETDLPYEMAKLNDVLEDMNRAGGVRIAVLDACRDNPLEQKLKRSITRTRSGAVGQGLAPIQKTEGSLFVFATQPGSVAEDGTGRNSPFTQALLSHIETPNLEVATLFRRVAGAVRNTTKGRQFPELTLSLVDEVYLKTQ